MSASQPAGGCAGFARCIVDWQRRHGRHDLPWQRTHDPYRVWLSEVMLQQTQVATVLPYYVRFLARFPDVKQLAAAGEAEVLALWSGMGYYSRARNLHRAARMVVARDDGDFPRTAAELEQLPGVGRSTAAAIAAFCFDERAAILDGNVRRVLTRAFAVEADVSQPGGMRTLWELADSLLPDSPSDMAAYTQGLMDLGAGVCTQRRPACLVCPILGRCRASAAGAPERYPLRTRRASRRQLAFWLLLARDESGRVWLEQRPGKGIWARLHSLPMFDSFDGLTGALPAGSPVVAHAPFRHVLTHRDLDLHVVATAVAPTDGDGAWYAVNEWQNLGLPAPVKRMLLRIEEQSASLQSPSSSR